MQLEARAKINLSLRITGKRPDGFHELETLMCHLSLHDDVRVEETSGEIALSLEGADLSAGPDNLAWRAADLYFKQTGLKKGAKIHLVKRIPAGGGLAGGSTDAAAVLRGLDRLFGTNLPFATLCDLGGQLGSDINFFLQDRPAICTGRGEKIEPVTLLDQWHVLLLNPGFGVPTPWAYKTYAADPKPGEPGRLAAQIERNGEKVTWPLVNDLEPPVFSKYFWIAEAKSWLRGQPGVLDSMMSGSGATVLALFASEQDALRVSEAAAAYFGPSAWRHVAAVNPV